MAIPDTLSRSLENARAADVAPGPGRTLVPAGTTGEDDVAGELHHAGRFVQRERSLVIAGQLIAAPVGAQSLPAGGQSAGNDPG